MTQEEYKIQLEMLWDDYNIMSRSYYFANKPEMKAEFWGMRDAQRGKLDELMKSYWYWQSTHPLTSDTEPISSDIKPTPVSLLEKQSKKLIEKAGDNLTTAIAKAEPKKKNRKHNVVNITVDGRTQPISQWAKESGIKKQTIYYRIFMLKWSSKDAVTTPLRECPISLQKSHTINIKEDVSTNRLTMTAFGKTKTLIQWADEYNLERTTLYTRIRALGWSPEKALTTPRRRAGRKLGDTNAKLSLRRKS